MKAKWKIVPLDPTEAQRLAGMAELPIESVQYTQPVYTAMITEPCHYPIENLFQRLREMSVADEVPGPYQCLALEIAEMLQL